MPGAAVAGVHCRRRVRARSLALVAVAAALAAVPVPPEASGAAPPAVPATIAERDGMQLSRTDQTIAPGAELTTFQRLESDKWLSAQALSIDLTSDLRVDHLAPEAVAAAAPLSELVAAHDPGEGRAVVAAINGDFFDINGSSAPLGPGISGGELVHSGTGTAVEAVGIGPDGAGRVLDVYFDGTLTLPTGEADLDGYNAAGVPEGGIGLYTARWGEADRAPAVAGADDVTEVVVEDGEVTTVSDKPGRGPVPDGATVLLGREAGAATLATLDAGDPVAVEYDATTGDGGPLPGTAVGGRGVLVVDGAPQDWEGRPNNATAPRTAVGFSRDGQEMFVLTVDGRQEHSGGTTLTELAVMMADLGAWSALNLDGGGSTTLLARAPGDPAPHLVNSPSDGQEREVPNGLAVTAPEGSGVPAGFRVATAVDPATAPTADAVPGGHPDRVFPGLTRRLTATPHDETYGPAEAGAVRWRADRPAVGRVDVDGVFHAARPGTTAVTAEAATGGRATGSLELTVLGELTRVTPTTRRLGLADATAAATFGLVGHDAAGNTAPVEPADATLAYDTSLFTVEPDPARGGFRVTAAPTAPDDPAASGTITVTVAGITTTLAVTVGLEETAVADFDDAGAWTFTQARAAGSLAPEPEGHDGAALAMTYDFGLSTATRAAYATPPADIPVPGQPQSFTLWIDGDGHGAWPSLQLTDAHGTSQVLRAPHITWEGWRQVTFDVPEGLAFPVSVRRLYLAETRPDQRYTGRVVLDGLRAHAPAEVPLPEEPAPADPLVAPGAEVAARDWRFAVVSDARLVAGDPDGAPVASARRTLREVRAADPDFVVVNGDWVDEGTPEDLAFARRVIEEELGPDLPWYYVPGDHEVTGGSIGPFEEEFGPAHRTFDHRGTRFITLDTSSLTLRGGGYEQIRELRTLLDDAARDPAIGSVVVLGHVPPRDPTARPAGRLTDRREAALLETWLSGFRRDTGKGVAFIGAHAGVFDAYHLEGVPYVVGGSAGTAPAAPPDEGGFTGWTLVGVDRADAAPHPAVPTAADRLSVETRPHVDGLTLAAPPALTVGATDRVTATVTQDAADGTVREVPVAFPVSADWSGSSGLHMGDPDSAGGRHIAALDPATGELTARRPGTVTVEVTVGDRSRRAEVTVTAP
ncbi:phosphodiester glycosidase family protein [Streptomyces specialis]|uniref:phosphodiester glycosidase family protein n=1 Tax=Streptomyces specialis TaxID=498367 RepID=UPI00099F3A67|nr:phosphodiester glycosidase family protein [Streptomyces specialis]